jgi:DNA topoisomerase VI subunit B
MSRTPVADGQTSLFDLEELRLETATKAKRNGKSVSVRSAKIAQRLAGNQREISVSEFFTKNRHLLGFDNPRKALLTAVKEAVDNALDACEEAGILPRLMIAIEPLTDTRLKVIVADNGPGIVKSQIPKIFAKLLYGSKFHSLKQSRGQQGIGISAAGMYGQLTTGKPIVITSKPSPRKPAHYYELHIDTRKNNPEILKEEDVEWVFAKTGTEVIIEMEGKYLKGKQSVDRYLEATSLANPHAEITYYPPSGDEFFYPRETNELPPEPVEIKPHPYGVELGMLLKMLRDTEEKKLGLFLKKEFSRVGDGVANQIAKKAGLDSKSWTSSVAASGAEKLYNAINETKIMAPPTNCISPIGDELIRRSLVQRIKADFTVAVSRPPSVYRGNPFLVEAGIAWGGDLPQEELVSLYRFANRVPLLYQQSGCAITNAAVRTDWRNYGLSQSKGALPSGPAVIFIHIASVWVPFTSESKEAIADYDEITKEVRLALQECGRKLATHIRKRKRQADERRKRGYIEKYLPHVGIALQEILGISDREKEKVVQNLTDVLEDSRGGATAVGDVESPATPEEDEGPKTAPGLPGTETSVSNSEL